ncbi:MAG: glycosyltransferase family 2 protein [Lachnospiraceae bacterium]|nr:glycosyltransferase family 2 protein [Lachnospiraceae bacterium]
MLQRRNKLVIIPAFNEAGCIVNTIEDIRQNAPSFDYVVINDCSRDETGELCEKYHYNVVNLPINSGIGAAVQTGYMYAKRYGYEYAIQVDGDGQHDASFLEEMAEIIEHSDVNMLIGSRFIEKEGFQSTGLRRFGIRYFTALIRLITRQTVTDPTSGMRIVDRNVINMFAEDYPKDYPEPETAVTVIKNGLTVREIPVRMKERQAGVSSISFKKSVYYMIKVSLACVMAAIGVK